MKDLVCVVADRHIQAASRDYCSDPTHSAFEMSTKKSL